jgi:hypothetical protein
MFLRGVWEGHDYAEDEDYVEGEQNQIENYALWLLYLWC